MSGIVGDDEGDETRPNAEAERPTLDPFAGIPGPEYEVRAADILNPLLDPGADGSRRWRRRTTNAPIVQVDNAYVTGVFDLRAANLGCLFRFENCRFEYPPDVREAHLLGLVFRQCWLPGLKARNLRSRNDVRLIRCRAEILSGDTGRPETSLGHTYDRERGKPEATVNLTDAVVEGSVVLTRSILANPHGKALQADRLNVTGAVLGYRMSADGAVRIPGMQAGGNVNFSGAYLYNEDEVALDGNGVHIRGSLLGEVDKHGFNAKRRRFTVRGTLLLSNAKIDSDLMLTGASLALNDTQPRHIERWEATDSADDPRSALRADRMRVEGNVELSEGFRASATLRMVNAYIGGTLSLLRASVRLPRGEMRPYYDRALHLDGSDIAGSLEATGLHTTGHLAIADTSIRGNFIAWNAELEHPGRDVLSARRSSVSGNFLLTDSDLVGTLRLQGIAVGGSVELYGTGLSGPIVSTSSSFSVDLRTSRIGRDVVLSSNGDRVFKAEGGVTLDGATIERKLNLNGARLSSTGAADGAPVPGDGAAGRAANRSGSGKAHSIALDVSDASADEFILTVDTQPQGWLEFSGAHCGNLDDNETIWSATIGIEVEDFTYEALSTPIELQDDAAVEKRLNRLRQAMNGYRPGPYNELAEMLRRAGNDEHADTVLQRKQQFRYDALARGAPFLGFGVRLWSLLQRATVGYGYRPSRALGWLLLLLVAGSLWFGLRTDDCIHNPAFTVSGPRCTVNRDDIGLEWNPVLYTADLLVPIVNFGHQGRWHMAGADMWVTTGMIAAGWVLATTVAAGASRSLRRYN